MDYLFSRRRLGIKWGLENIRHLVDELDHPEKAFPAIHVAGTNGKGSSCAMLESIYRAAGYKTGLYTSPHLVDVCERIRVNGDKIPLEELADLVGRLKPVAEREGCSFFEILTAAAFEYFRREQVDVAIVETGMGGRLDATNILSPHAVLITELDLDHVKSLGNTVLHIAEEKAGIIKSGVPVVLNDRDPQVVERLRQVCADRSADFYPVMDLVKLRASKLQAGGSHFSCVTPTGEYEDLWLALPGAHQVDNSLAVIRVVEVLAERGFPVQREALETGLARVVWPGRLQQLQEKPTVVVDVAHNLQGMRASGSALRDLFPHERFICMLGLLADKPAAEIAGFLAEFVDVFVTVTPEDERALPAEQLTRILRESGCSVQTGGTIEKGLQMALNLADEHSLVGILGSHFVIGKVLQLHKKC